MSTPAALNDSLMKQDPIPSSETVLVSIVIPTYQRRHYLESALTSAVAQTYTKIEIIISEDGGQNYSQDVASAFADPRIRVRWNGSQLGVAGNTLAAMADARGDFIVNLSDDDLLDPRFVAGLLAPLLHDDSIVVAFCDHYVIDENGKLLPEITETNSRHWGRFGLKGGRHADWLQMALLNQSVPMAMGAIFRASAVRLSEFPLSAGSFWDLYLTYLLWKSGGAAWYEPERFSSYRIHGAQETATGRLRFANAGLFCNDVFLADPQLAVHRSTFARRWMQSAIDVGTIALQLGRTAEARKQFLAAVRRGPNLRAIAGLLLSTIPSGLSVLFLNAAKALRETRRKRP